MNATTTIAMNDSVDASASSIDQGNLSAIAEALSQPRLSRHAVVLLRAMRETGTLRDQDLAAFSAGTDDGETRLEARRALFRRRRPAAPQVVDTTENVPSKPIAPTNASVSYLVSSPSATEEGKERELIAAVLKKRKELDLQEETAAQHSPAATSKRIKVALEGTLPQRRTLVGQCA